MNEDTRSFLITFVGIGAVALVATGAYYLSEEFGRPEAARWLALSIIVSIFGAIKWCADGYHDMPWPIRSAAALVVATIFGRTAYLFAF